MPSEPAESNFKTKVRATAYPCVERGGIDLGLSGPARRRRRRCPTSSRTCWPGRRVIQIYQRECNWVQALEGDIDTVPHGVPAPRPRGGRRHAAGHVRALRAHRSRPALRGGRHGLRRDVRRLPARRRRTATTGASRNFLFPFYAMVADRRAGPRGARARVGADGRRAHAGAHDQPRGAAAVAHRRPSGAEPARDAAEHDRLVRPLPLRGQRRQRLPDRSRGAAEERQLHRHRRDLPAGPGRHREHGRDLRSHAGAPGQQRCRW